MHSEATDLKKAAIAFAMIAGIVIVAIAFIALAYWVLHLG